MKKSFIKGVFATLAALFVTTGAHSAECGSQFVCPYEYDPCSWGFEVGVDFLYWKPCISDLDYAIYFPGPVTRDIGVEQGEGKYRSVEHDYVPGFRAKVQKADILCCWDLGVEFTYLKDKKNTTTRGLAISTRIDGRFNDFFPYSKITARHEFTYNNLDILLGKEICFSECHSFKPFFGVDMLWLDQTFKSKLHSEEDVYASTRWSNDLSAYGLKAGSAYTLEIGCGFELYGIASGSILYGDSDVSQRFHYVNNVEEPIETRVRYTNDGCKCLFGWRVEAGVRYDLDFCEVPLALNLGYQFLQWRNLPGVSSYDDDAGREGFSIDRTSTFGFHGIVVGLDTNF